MANSDLQVSAETRAEMARITLSTGELTGRDPIDIVFTSVQVARVGDSSIQSAFDRARDELRLAALAAGGDSVMCCRFELTTHSAMHLKVDVSYGESIFTVHAYGTAAKAPDRAKDPYRD